MKSVIYTYINKKNNKLYIGSTINFSGRKALHLLELRNQCHHSLHLQRAVNKYGIESFEFKVLEEVVEQSKLLEREQYYLDLYKSYLPKNGYNICKIAGRTLGVKRSPESIEKWKEAVLNGKGFGRGGKQGWKLRVNITEVLNFYKPSITTLQECANKFRISTDTIIKILRNNHIQIIQKRLRGKENPFFGKTHSKKVIQLISKGNKGKVISIQQRELARQQMLAYHAVRKHIV